MDNESPSPAELRALLARDGFVRIPSFLSTEHLQSLRAACERTTNMARNGDWPFIRTLPKQFPPWSADVSSGIWGVQHLMHPDLPDHHLFASSYFSPHIIRTVSTLLQCSPDHLVMELYNLLVRPDHDFALRWHRDDIPPHVAADEEEIRLNHPITHAQWNLPLYDDHSLLVPGSHSRPRTQLERDAHPFESNLPGQIRVSMNAGDVLFYNNNILHRGIYSASVERMTLHGSMGRVGPDPARARNVLQHGVGEWVRRCHFDRLDTTPGGLTGIDSLAEDMKTRLLAIGTDKDVAFFSPDE